ncbi:hypothetical protein PICMEDRAFT_16333 [Pichia membranifaciens NRRL Y-2026]|uniref:Mediator of RNA polymerase II transcription subunit 31 n=1 Tax=Pichia membranifaciens NRRL Y-2026 TaxID=763406 RepID=A0A1E3NJX3_9ASCO|nr:hypothetical protein PICMEDRAFT_16333 [Pichia membranifaciens NRRL Y-2026]ODQ46442.1 hypothetical protein PICMEDRAFT_16333 [Pichia membranifaciens NRRL Y-2026]
MSQSDEDLPTRWEIELEFVQSLANTQYLTYLAQLGYFKDESFLNYLNYLNYWKQPSFAKFLVYPDCLHILTLLQNEQFRNEILNPNFTNVLYNDMAEYWKEPLFRDEKEREREREEKERRSKLPTASPSSPSSPSLVNTAIPSASPDSKSSVPPPAITPASVAAIPATTTTQLPNP